MKTLRNLGIFKTYMRAERKESSTVMADNIFPMRISGPFDSLGYLDLRQIFKKWLTQISDYRVTLA